MDIGLRLERGSLITIVWTINFIVFSTRLAAIGKSLPKYISAYEMDGYKDVFIIFILRQQIPTLGSGPCRLQLLETDCQSRHSEKWKEERDTVKREKRVKAPEGSISKHKARCRLHLQQDLPCQVRTAQPQQALQLCKRLTMWPISFLSETDGGQYLHLICNIFLEQS